VFLIYKLAILSAYICPKIYTNNSIHSLDSVSLTPPRIYHGTNLTILLHIFTFISNFFAFLPVLPITILRIAIKLIVLLARVKLLAIIYLPLLIVFSFLLDIYRLSSITTILLLLRRRFVMVSFRSDLIVLSKQNNIIIY
jgi:hypothetical protein